jgi:DNA processing protein
MSRLREREQAAFIALLRTRPGRASEAEITAEVRAEGSALEVWHRLVPDTLLDPPGEPDALTAAARDLARWTERDCVLVTILDPDYPARLRAVPQAPPVLFARGPLTPDDPAVSVVGSRRVSAPGLALTAEVARGLVARGVSVMAGLALGVDAAAHRAALDAGGRTVAVIGTGLSRAYPAGHRALQEEIAARGLLLSQFWPDAPPQKHTFLMRNATMAGYGLATIVTEAGEQSGARAQARMSAEHGRPVILAAGVVDQNEWAQALASRPGVQVAAGPAAVLRAVDQLLAERAAAGSELATA